MTTAEIRSNFIAPTSLNQTSSNLKPHIIKEKMGSFNSTPKIKWPKETDFQSSNKVTKITKCTCTHEFSHTHAHPTSSCRKTKSASFINSMGSRSTNHLSKSNSKLIVSLAFSQAATLRSGTAGKVKEDGQDELEGPSPPPEEDEAALAQKKKEMELLDDLALLRKGVTHLIGRLEERIEKYATLMLRGQEQTMVDLDEILDLLPSGSAKIQFLDLRGSLIPLHAQKLSVLEDDFRAVAEALPLIWSDFISRDLEKQSEICKSQHRNSKPICCFRALTALRRGCEEHRALDAEIKQRVGGSFEELLVNLNAVEGDGSGEAAVRR